MPLAAHSGGMVATKFSRQVGRVNADCLRDLAHRRRGGVVLVQVVGRACQPERRRRVGGRGGPAHLDHHLEHERLDRESGQAVVAMELARKSIPEAAEIATHTIDSGAALRAPDKSSPAPTPEDSLPGAPQARPAPKIALPQITSWSPRIWRPSSLSGTITVIVGLPDPFIGDRKTASVSRTGKALGRDVGIGERDVLHGLSVGALVFQRAVVALEHGDEQGQGQERMGAQLE